MCDTHQYVQTSVVSRSASVRTQCIIMKFSKYKHCRMIALDLKETVISPTFPDIGFWMQNAFHISSLCSCRNQMKLNDRLRLMSAVLPPCLIKKNLYVSPPTSPRKLLSYPISTGIVHFHRKSSFIFLLFSCFNAT